MYFLFSGEGETDLGTGLQKGLCEGDAYLYGPLTLLTDRIVSEKGKYSLMESQWFGFVSKADLKRRFDNLKPLKKFRFPRGDIKHEQGTKYFRNNARALAAIAQEVAQEKNDEVVAVLFRDSDRKNSSEQADWEKKWDSMLNGFQDERFNRGVPMIPKPVSEAWILCAIYRKENKDKNCGNLENQKRGSDPNRHASKIELENTLGEQPTREQLNHKIQTGKIDTSCINLDSFNRFKQQLEKVI